jgi:hypothetical protein
LLLYWSIHEYRSTGKIKMKILIIAALVLFTASCGPYNLKSYQPDNKIRADYLVKTVRVKYRLIPKCRHLNIIYLYHSKKCKEPYTLEAEFISTRAGNDSNQVNLNSVLLKNGNREYELLSPADKNGIISLKPFPDGTFRTKRLFDLGKIVERKKTKKFNINLKYRFIDGDEINAVEKDFEYYEDIGFISPFTGYKSEEFEQYQNVDQDGNLIKWYR